MANFLDKIGGFAKTAADKTNDMIEQSRLNAKISAEEAVIAEQKAQIGNFYWERYSSGVQTEDAIQQWCEAIKSSQATITALRGELAALKGEQMSSAPAEGAASVKCPSCGKENAGGTKFCGECGGKLG